MANLPAQVYTDLANASLPTVTLPVGTYTVIQTLLVFRSNVTINCEGCILEANPVNSGPWGNEFYPFKVASNEEDPPVIWDESPGGTDRKVSKLSGTVTAATTTLTMDPAEEPVGLVPGEVVMLLLGVDVDDPAEPYAYRAAEILSVNYGTGVITFTEPIGIDVPDYVDQATLEALVDDSIDWKVDPWGTWSMDPFMNPDANFAKGYGTHHGMQRFNGGMLENVVVNDLTLNLTSNLNEPTIPNGIWPVSCIAVRGVTFNNLTVHNPIGNMVHWFKCFDMEVNGCTVTGQGISKPGSGFLAEAYAFTQWGGDDLRYYNVNISGNDIIGFGAEVNAGRIDVRDFSLDCVYTSARNYESSPIIFGFISVIDIPVVHNATIKAVTTGGTTHAFDGFTPIKYTGQLKYIGPSLTTTFDFGNLKNPDFTDVVAVQFGNKAYGPQGTVNENVTIAHSAMTPLAIPGMVVKVARFRIITLGDLRDIDDNIGGGSNYWEDATASGPPYPWVTFNAGKWHQILQGSTELSNYTGKFLRFWFNAGTAQSAVIEFDYQYLPRRTLKKYHS